MLKTVKLVIPKVLIVEDDPVISHDIELLLQNHGYEVSGIAYNAVQALDILAKREIEFAILDIHLGSGDSGIDVAHIIHKKYKIPYIFLTSFSDKATLQSAIEEGPYGYLVKPFQEDTLISTVSLAIHNHGLQNKSNRIHENMHHLTDQEKTICEKLYSGKSYQSIADELFISINTVRYHVKNLYIKYDVNGRAELVAKLLKAH